MTSGVFVSAMLVPFARGLSLFLGGFTLLNLAGDLRFAGSDANLWWIDFRFLPVTVSRAILCALAALLIAYAFAPRPRRWRRALTTALLAFATIVALGNAILFYALLARGAIRSTIPLPFSLLVALALIAILIAQFREPQAQRALFAMTFVAAGILFPLAQITLFGLTDYRRAADAIVVFGARAYANGTPSPALADRVRTGCALYRDGLAPRVIFSGGPGEGAFDEPETMRRFANTLGVPNAAIVLDPHGVNTESTVRNTAQRGVRILAVSHFYHLPRIKMTYARYGVDVWTVPATTSSWRGMIFNLVREDAAFWAYYLRRLR
ncbi:MAG TPA: YdcF family protein [Thermoanaerobaculia bacterium]|nr:YdcF family protein [Thermoanaerobaculia bacterium]